MLREWRDSLTSNSQKLARQSRTLPSIIAVEQIASAMCGSRLYCNEPSSAVASNFRSGNLHAVELDTRAARCSVDLIPLAQKLPYRSTEKKGLFLLFTPYCECVSARKTAPVCFVCRQIAARPPNRSGAYSPTLPTPPPSPPPPAGAPLPRRQRSPTSAATSSTRTSTRCASALPFTMYRTTGHSSCTLVRLAL